MLEITSSILGPVSTNTYLLADTQSREAVIIDPADGSCRDFIAGAMEKSYHIRQIWLTHAHFDHTAGIETVRKTLGESIPVALHPDDLPLWRTGGGGRRFGLDAIHGFDPELELAHGQVLQLGEFSFEVRHVPGHAHGHVAFYNATENVLFCGDVIFQQSIGRTDFAEGDYDTLMRSIREQVLTLPDATRLLPGHGPETNVASEKRSNPFLK